MNENEVATEIRRVIDDSVAMAATVKEATGRETTHVEMPISVLEEWGRKLEGPWISINPDVAKEGDSFAWKGETWYLTKQAPEGGGFKPENLRHRGAPDVPMTPTIADAQAAVGWMSARADDICGDEQRQEWAKQIVTLDRFLYRLSIREVDAPSVDLEIPHPPHVRISVDALATAQDIAAVADHYDGGEPSAEPKAPRLFRPKDDVVQVSLADLRALRAMLPKRESEKETDDDRGFARATWQPGPPCVKCKGKTAIHQSLDAPGPDYMPGRYVKIQYCLDCGRRDHAQKPEPEYPLGFLSHEETQAKLQRARHVSAPEAPKPVEPRLCEERGWCELPFEHEGRCAPTEPPKMVRCDPCRMWHGAPAHTKEGAKT